MLTDWRTIIDGYRRRWVGAHDLPYWYKEPTNVSLLAGAIWRGGQGRSCLQEYPTTRSRHGEVGEGKVDLWFQAGDWDALVETKTRWPTEEGAEVGTRTGKAVASAGKQLAAVLSNHRARHGYKLCFVVPYIKADADPSPWKQAKAIASQLRARVEQYPKRALYAEYFVPAKTWRHYQTGTGRVAPGVIIVGHQQWPATD
jgi:hypothetical protein